MVIIYRLLLIAVLLMGGYTVYKGWTAHQAYRDLGRAPVITAIGPADAKITITEFFDYRCSGCRFMAPTIKTIIAQNLDVRFIFRHLPMYDAPSIKEARVALAAAMQGKFEETHDALISRTEPLADNEIPILAQSLGLDPDRLARDMKSDAVTNTLLQTLDIATALNINVAPSFLLNKTLYTYTTQPPSADDFQRLIDQARGPVKANKAKPAPVAPPASPTPEAAPPAPAPAPEAAAPSAPIPDTAPTPPVPDNAPAAPDVPTPPQPAPVLQVPAQ